MKQQVKNLTEKQELDLRLECLRLAVAVRGLVPSTNTTEIAEAFLAFVKPPPASNRTIVWTSSSERRV